MNYTENFEGIKLDVQAVDFTPEKQVEERIRKMILYLKRFSNEIVYITIHLEIKGSKSTEQESAKVILGVPGPDIIATEKGDNFMALLTSIEQKLARQLKK